MTNLKGDLANEILVIRCNWQHIKNSNSSESLNLKIQKKILEKNLSHLASKDRNSSDSESSALS